MSDTCEHQYEHLGTTKWNESGGGYNLKWVRIERFFCIKCLERKDVRQEDWSRDTPEWYR